MRPHELTVKVSDLEAHYGVLKASLNDLAQEVSDASIKRNDIYKEIDEARAVLDSVEREVSGLIEKKALVLREIEYAETRSQVKLENELAIHIAAVEEARRLVGEARATITATIRQQEELEDHILALRSIIRETQEDIEDAKEELARLDDLTEDRAEIYRAYEQKIEVSRTQLEAFQEEELRAFAELEELDEKIESRRAEYAAFHDKLAIREEAVSKKERDLQTLRARFDEYSIKNFGYRAPL